MSSALPRAREAVFYRVDMERETCECKDRAPVCKHLFAATIFAAKKRCRRATTERPQRRHGQPSGSLGAPAVCPRDNTSALRDTTTPRRTREVKDSLRGAVPVSMAMAGLERMEG